MLHSVRTLRVAKYKPSGQEQPPPKPLLPPPHHHHHCQQGPGPCQCDAECMCGAVPSLVCVDACIEAQKTIPHPHYFHKAVDEVKWVLRVFLMVLVAV